MLVYSITGLLLCTIIIIISDCTPLVHTQNPYLWWQTYRQTYWIIDTHKTFISTISNLPLVGFAFLKFSFGQSGKKNIVSIIEQSCISAIVIEGDPRKFQMYLLYAQLEAEEYTSWGLIIALESHKKSLSFSWD